MKVLITGGGGFVGSHLADGFLARGDEVFVLDNGSVSEGAPSHRAPAASTTCATASSTSRSSKA